MGVTGNVLPKHTSKIPSDKNVPIGKERQSAISLYLTKSKIAQVSCLSFATQDNCATAHEKTPQNTIFIENKLPEVRALVTRFYLPRYHYEIRKMAK